METTKSNSSTTPVTSVCYIEVNSNSILNVGNYALANGQPLFNIGVIFAANINADANNNAVLFLNPQVSALLQDAANNIVPLQQKGIKVLLTVLGNYADVGISNFQTPAAAQAFAQQLSDAVNVYGLDGIDFDDEWVKYPTQGPGVVNDNSFTWLVTALRELMPDKIISFYAIGPAYDNLQPGASYTNLINYSWNPYYSQYNPVTVPGLTNANLAAAAVDVLPGDNTYTPVAEAVQFAQQTLNDGYGVYLYYNLTSNNIAAYLSEVSQVLYGQATIYTGPQK